MSDTARTTSASPASSTPCLYPPLSPSAARRRALILGELVRRSRAGQLTLAEIESDHRFTEADLDTLEREARHYARVYRAAAASAIEILAGPCPTCDRFHLDGSTCPSARRATRAPGLEAVL